MKMFGFSAEIVEEYFTNEIQRGIEQARKNLTGEAVKIPAPIFADESEELASIWEDLDADTEKMWKMQDKKRLTRQIKRMEDERSAIEFNHEMQLELMIEFNANLVVIDDEKLERIKKVNANTALSEQEKADMLVMINEAAAMKLTDVWIQESIRLQEEWLAKWEFLTSSVEQLSHTMAETIMTDTKDIADVWRKAWGQMGRTIVHALINQGLKALWRFIAAEATQITMLATETAAVATLTAAYIALATAKAAAGVGTGGLSFLFDNPIHDINLINRTSTATQDIFRERKRVNNFIEDGISRGMQRAGVTEPTAEPISLTFNISGNVDEAHFRRIVQDIIGPELEELSLNGPSNLAMKPRMKVMR